MERWNNAKWCHLAVNWTPATVEFSVFLCRYTCSVPCLCSHFNHYRALISKSRHPLHTRLGRRSEWMGFNSYSLDGLPMQFFKTHFTDTTDAIKDPQRNISIEECLYFALIVHLLWQTSKSKISALLNAVARDVVIIQAESQCFFSTERKV